MPVMLSGTLRWVERVGDPAALLVERGKAAGRRLSGRTLTLALAATAIRTVDRDGDGRRTVADLLPGDAVTVKARRAPDARAMDLLIAPTRLVVDGP